MLVLCEGKGKAGREYCGQLNKDRNAPSAVVYVAASACVAAVCLMVSTLLLLSMPDACSNVQRPRGHSVRGRVVCRDTKFSQGLSAQPGLWVCILIARGAKQKLKLLFFLPLFAALQPKMKFTSAMFHPNGKTSTLACFATGVAWKFRRRAWHAHGLFAF